jgi:hypothetical protein
MNIFFKILLTLFLSGFTAVTAQALFFREASAWIAQGEFAFPLTVASWALGAVFAGPFFEKWLKPKKDGYLMLSLAFFPTAALLLLPLGIASIKFMSVFIGPASVHAAGPADLFLVLIVLAVPGFCLTMASSAAGELLSRRSAGVEARAAFLASALGGLIAGLLYSNFIVSMADNMTVMYFTGILNLGAVYVMFRDRNKDGRIVISTMIIVLLVYLVPLVLGTVKNADKNFASSVFGSSVILESSEGLNSRVSLVKEDNTYRMFSGNSLLYKRPDPKYAALASVKSANTLLVKGMFSGGLEALIMNKNAGQITCVEPDPGAATVLARFFKEDIRDAGRVKYVFTDPATAVSKDKSGVKYDAIIIDHTGTGVMNNKYMLAEYISSLVKSCAAPDAKIYSIEESGLQEIKAAHSVYSPEYGIKDFDLKDLSKAGIFILVFALGLSLFPAAAFFRTRAGVILFIASAGAGLTIAAAAFFFQAAYGYLYRGSGLLLAFLMMGFLMGGFFVFAFSGRMRGAVPGLLGLAAAGMTLFFAKEILNFSVIPSTNIVIFMMVLIGAVMGAAFCAMAYQGQWHKAFTANGAGLAAGAAAGTIVLALAGPYYALGAGGVLFAALLLL